MKVLLGNMILVPFKWFTLDDMNLGFMPHMHRDFALQSNVFLSMNFNTTRVRIVCRTNTQLPHSVYGLLPDVGGNLRRGSLEQGDLHTFGLAVGGRFDCY